MSGPKLTATVARAAVALAANLLLVTGCATNTADTQWADPQFAGRSLRGANVLIVCEAADLVVKRICQDEVAAKVTAFGAVPVIGPDPVTPTPGRPDQYLPAARAAGAAGILTTSIVADASVVNPGPSFSFGIGGFGGGRGSGVGGGIGIGVPIGGAEVTTGHAANSMLTDVASGRLMWTVKATSPPSPNVNAQVADLAKRVVDAAHKAGLF